MKKGQQYAALEKGVILICRQNLLDSPKPPAQVSYADIYKIKGALNICFKYLVTTQY